MRWMTGGVVCQLIKGELPILVEGPEREASLMMRDATPFILPCPTSS